GHDLEVLTAAPKKTLFFRKPLVQNTAPFRETPARGEASTGMGGFVEASRERAMRKVLVLGLFSLGVASLVCAAQRGAMAPSAPAMRAMPAAPAVGAHAAVGAHGAAAPHGAPVRTGTHAGAVGGHAAGRRTVGNPMQPQPSSGGNGFSGGNGSGGNGFSGRNGFFPFFPQPTPILPGVSDFFASTYPVPGLGFDYAHFFAVHPNWGRFHPVDGVTLPFFGGGGFYMPVPYYTESTPEEGEPEPSAPQQPVSTHP